MPCSGSAWLWWCQVTSSKGKWEISAKDNDGTVSNQGKCLSNFMEFELVSPAFSTLPSDFLWTTPHCHIRKRCTAGHYLPHLYETSLQPPLPSPLSLISKSVLVFFICLFTWKSFPAPLLFSISLWCQSSSASFALRQPPRIHHRCLKLYFQALHLSQQCVLTVCLCLLAIPWVGP